jgi:phosphatidylglycerol:prolipoprotein diacylglycerol transferase
MRPILFHWQRLTIHSYTAMLYVGLVAGLVAGDAAAHAAGIDALRTYIASSILIVPALLGARVLYVAVHLGFNRQNLRRVWNRHEGGASQYGALVLAVPLSVPLTSALRLPLGAFWDVATFTILVGMIFVRIGCLMHGCCAGRKSESWLGLYLPNHRGVWEKRFPTQCLEAGWAAVLLTFAIVFGDHCRICCRKACARIAARTIVGRRPIQFLSPFLAGPNCPLARNTHG